MSDFRTPAYLSPSALSKWEGDADSYFLQYIVPEDIRPARSPQTGPMSVGSAFDAIVKNSLYKTEFGEDACLRDGYRLRDLVAAQCEEHTLPDSLVIASDVFDQYTECGALANLRNLIAEFTHTTTDGVQRGRDDRRGSATRQTRPSLLHAPRDARHHRLESFRLGVEVRCVSAAGLPDRS